GALQRAATGEGFEHDVDGECFVAAAECHPSQRAGRGPRWELAEDDGEVPAGVHVFGGEGDSQDLFGEGRDEGRVAALDFLEGVGGAVRDDDAFVVQGVDEFVDERVIVEGFADDFVGGAEVAGGAGGEAVAEGGHWEWLVVGGKGNGKSNSKGKRRSPAGMTTGKATATTKAKARTKAKAKTTALARLNARYHHPVFLRKPRVGHPATAKANADPLRG